MEKLGLSGDTIIIENNYVVKICDTDQERFLKNCIKQDSFNNPYIKSVPIISQGVTDDKKNFIKMPLLKCNNAIEWLSKSNISEVQAFVNILNNYFSHIIGQSEIKEFDTLVWQTKIDDLKNKIKDNDLIEILNVIQQLIFKNGFYYGDYHGDLTLTNLFIFSNGSNLSVEAIDFLDSFIQSPLNDLVKIRQDTQHLWTLTLLKNQSRLDRSKVLILLNYIDGKIEQIISKNEILSEFYLPFQILNLMRIVPYNKDERIFHYLKQEIKGLFHEFNANHALRGQINKI